MAIREIRQRVVTCDRCRREMIQEIDAAALPTAWGHVRLEVEGPEGPEVSEVDLCTEHVAELKEAVRPLVRSRRASPEQPALAGAG